MTFTAVGSLTSAENAVAGTSTTFALTTTTAGDFILVSLCANSQPATVVTSSRVTWTQLTSTFSFTSMSPTGEINHWLGTVNSAGSDTVTVTFASSLGGNNCRFDAREFHSSVGNVALDTTGTVTAATANWATLTPAGTGELYWGWCEDSGSAVSGSTSGFTYEPDSHSNGCGFALNVSSAYTPVWGDSGMIAGVMVLVKEVAAAASPAVITAPPPPPAAPVAVPPQVITGPVRAPFLTPGNSARPGAATPGAAQPGNPGPAPPPPAVAAALVTAPAVPPPVPLTIPPQVITGPLITAGETDAAAGADALSVSAAVSFADAAAALDQQAPYADEAAAADALAVTVTGIAPAVITAPPPPPPFPWPSPAIPAQLIYPGGAAVADTDAAGAADALSVAVSVPLADTGAADEYGSADGMRQDQGGAADTLSVTETSLVALADAAAATEWQYADGSRPDTGGASDALAATVAVSLADAAAAADWSYADGSRGDEAGGADALAAAAGAPLPDAGGAADQVTAAVTGAGWADAAGGADAISVTVTVANTGHVEWLVTPAAARWRVMPETARWNACPAPPRWKAVLMNFDPVAAISLEEVNVNWTAELAGTSVDPTGQTAGQPQLSVLFAFPQSSGNPLAPAEPSVWFTGAWLTGTNIRGYIAQCLVGPGGVVTLTAGQAYDTWSQVEGTPASPKKFAGVLEVY